MSPSLFKVGFVCAKRLTQFLLPPRFQIVATTSHPLPTPILAVTPLDDASAILLQDIHGVLTLATPSSSNTFQLEPWTGRAQGSGYAFPLTLAAPCDVIAHHHIDSADQDVVIGLTAHHQLVLNDASPVAGWNSFAIHDACLIACSDQQNLCFVPHTQLLHKSAADLLHTAKQKAYDHSVRAVERGARIVAVSRQGTDVILQMPRGNLELVSPRVLVLHRCRQLLSQSDYRKAFALLRKHRLSLNLLHDFQPEEFMANIERVVTALNTADNLNLFLSELLDQDVTQTMYPPLDAEVSLGRKRESGMHIATLFLFAMQPALTNATVSPSQFPFMDKVNRICDAIRAEVTRVDSTRYLTTILTTYLKSQPMRIEDALQHVLQLHQEAETAGMADPAAAERPRSALKYMALLVDVDILYNTALGAYNLPFALMVAQVAQKDPKEYLPFLQQLRTLPEHLRRYNIDMHLKHYSRALCSLAAGGTEHLQQCIDLAKEHSLFPVLLDVYSAAGEASKDLYHAAAKAYAQQLLAKKRADEAAVLFEAAQDLPAALQAYTTACMWAEAMSLAFGLSESPEERQQRAKQLAEALRLRQRHAEAARLMELYGGDIEAAVALYIEAAAWTDAVRVAQTASSTEHRQLVSSLVEPQLAVHMQTVIQQYGELTTLIQQRATRLKIVRETKAQQAQELEDGGDGGPDAGDIYSEASAPASRVGGSSQHSRATSRRSKSSTRTARSRRRNEAKKLSLREGGPYEESALVNAIHGLVRQIDDGAAQVRLTNLVAIRLGQRPAAVQLQAAYAAARTACKACIPQVWPKMAPTVVRSAIGGVGGAELTTNARVAALLQQQQQQQSDKGSWQADREAAAEDAQNPDDADEVELPPRPTMCEDSVWKLESLEQ